MTQPIQRQTERIAFTDSLGASVGHNEHLQELARAPWLQFSFECVGPVESRRAEYVVLRDERDRLKAMACGSTAQMRRMRPAWRAIERRMATIPQERKWLETGHNLVTDVGANDLLDKYFAGSSYTAAWYLGLIDNASFSAVAAADTMSSHAGWIESVAYSNATRVSMSWSSASARAKATSAAASFNINATATINGGFVTTVSTKSGTTGILYSCKSFASTRAVISGDTLNVSYTANAT